jgi:hypothetical protein
MRNVRTLKIPATENSGAISEDDGNAGQKGPRSAAAQCAFKGAIDPFGHASPGARRLQAHMRGAGAHKKGRRLPPACSFKEEARATERAVPLAEQFACRRSQHASGNLGRAAALSVARRSCVSPPADRCEGPAAGIQARGLSFASHWAPVSTT